MVADYQESYQLVLGGDPFSELKGDGSEVDLDQAEDELFTLHNPKHHHDHQLLIITLTTHAQALPKVPCSTLKLLENATLVLQQEFKPSIMVTYARSRSGPALNLLSLFSNIQYPDTRKVSGRITLGGASPEYVSEIVQHINDSGGAHLLRVVAEIGGLLECLLVFPFRFVNFFLH